MLPPVCCLVVMPLRSSIALVGARYGVRRSATSTTFARPCAGTFTRCVSSWVRKIDDFVAGGKRNVDHNNNNNAMSTGEFQDALNKISIVSLIVQSILLFVYVEV